MTLFWIIAGLLMAGALVFVVPPLLGGRRRRAGPGTREQANVQILRDQLRELDADVAAGTISRDQFEQARREIEQRVLEDGAGEPTAVAAGGHGRIAAVVVGIAIPVLAVAIYLVLGSPKALDPKVAAARPAQEQQAHEITPEQIAAMVENLAERMKANPDNVEGWVMLARSYNAMQRFPEAAQAYAQAIQRVPDNAQLLADYADVLAMVQGRKLEGEPEKLIKRALEVDPNNLKALLLAGTVAFDRQDFKQAAAHWEKARGMVPPESDFARSIGNSIAEARQKGGLAAAAPVASPAAAAPAQASARISGTVRLAPGLAAKAGPTDTVFVFARAPSGPRMPLAIVRKQVKDLPLEFSLDDSMAMAPNMRLSNFPQVVVGARVSKAGSATPQPGDLEGATQPVAVGSSGVAVTIESEVK
ncbi:MAG TPA: c-type cytochrome biogenesis protein CcmI [Rhodocyclaceae bacterium]|nr:c-type cytochrome biogenesis protein CcmI [Rhodocyclaceae bacterium]